MILDITVWGMIHRLHSPKENPRLTRYESPLSAGLYVMAIPANHLTAGHRGMFSSSGLRRRLLQLLEFATFLA
ncbi:hypothetical protein BMS3Bbin04_01867 [bacterium BMS3Bbin04]|nr:hypothetical protein BMS3Bbin04_01867 [bacterium BMS3Bbin04]